MRCFHMRVDRETQQSVVTRRVPADTGATKEPSPTGSPTPTGPRSYGRRALMSDAAMRHLLFCVIQLHFNLTVLHLKGTVFSSDVNVTI